LKNPPNNPFIHQILPEIRQKNAEFVQKEMLADGTFHQSDGTLSPIDGTLSPICHRFAQRYHRLVECYHRFVQRYHRFVKKSDGFRAISLCHQHNNTV